MIFIYIMLIFISFMFIYLLRQIDTAITLIYNRLNIEEEIWGSDKDV